MTRLLERWRGGLCLLRNDGQLRDAPSAVSGSCVVGTITSSEAITPERKQVMERPLGTSRTILTFSHHTSLSPRYPPLTHQQIFQLHTHLASSYQYHTILHYKQEVIHDRGKKLAPPKYITTDAGTAQFILRQHKCASSPPSWTTSAPNSTRRRRVLSSARARP